MNLKSRLATLATTSAFAAVALGAAAVAPASAATAPNGPNDAALVANTSTAAAGTWTSLYIYDFNDGNYWVTVEGKGNLKKFTQGNMNIELWGDDTFLDDIQWQEWPVTSNPDGSFRIEFPVCCSALNEDDLDKDEIYAKVSLYDGVGHSNLQYSKNFTGWF